jgi:phosphoribosylformimino-5-aminoimidazole carboxamide ribotide isomerase
MQVVPVLDVMKGQVVRGIAGRRAEYRPVVSTLTASARPGDVAEALRARFGFMQFYLADLDAIGGQPPTVSLYAELQVRDFHLWVDAGLRRHEDVRPLLESGVDTLIAGLETLAGPESLAKMVEHAGPERVIFSLDLKEGRPLGALACWPVDAAGIAETALQLGVRRLLVLDLARVGLGAGVGHLALCADLRRRHADVEITAGGGVRGLDDLHALRDAGVDFALVASALHDGRLTPEMLGAL